MDTVLTEDDIAQTTAGTDSLLTLASLDSGLDKYVRERINAIFDEKTLGQIYRLNDVKFINKDVQKAFRVNDQSARSKIQKWEDAGIVKHTGTRAPEGEHGGKPSNEYSIVDARVHRIMRRKLVALEEHTLVDEDQNDEVEDRQE